MTDSKLSSDRWARLCRTTMNDTVGFSTTGQTSGSPPSRNWRRRACPCLSHARWDGRTSAGRALQVRPTMRSKHQDDTRCLARSGKGSRVHTPRTTRYRSSTLAGRNARIRVRTRFFCRRMISVRLCKGDLKYPSFAICGLGLGEQPCALPISVVHIGRPECADQSADPLLLPPHDFRQALQGRSQVSQFRDLRLAVTTRSISSARGPTPDSCSVTVPEKWGATAVLCRGNDCRSEFLNR